MQNNLLQIHNLVELTGQSMATLPFLMLVQSLHITKPTGRSQQQRIELNILIQIMVPGYLSSVYRSRAVLRI